MTTAFHLVMLNTLGIHVDFDIPFVCALLNLGLTIPSSPSCVGVTSSLVYSFCHFGVPKHEGFTISIIFHKCSCHTISLVSFHFVSIKWTQKALKFGETKLKIKVELLEMLIFEICKLPR